MKHRFVKLLLFMLVLLAAQPSAYAQDNLPAQAGQGWHQTYEAYGRTITVDIPIQIPNVTQYPILTATYTPLLTTPVVSDWPDPTLFQETGCFRFDSHSPKHVMEISKQYPAGTPRGMDVQPIYIEYNQLEWDTAYAYNNPCTVQDGQTMLDAVWTDNFPDIPIQFIPYAAYATGEMRAYNEKSDQFSGNPFPYQGLLMVYFHQVMNDIPILCIGDECFGHFDQGPFAELHTFIGATAIQNKLADNVTLLHVAITQNMLLQTGIPQEDYALCNLDQVIQTYETLIQNGLLREVSSLQLGYVAWKTADDTFLLIPTWVLTGMLYPDADTENKVIAQNEDPRIQEYGCILVDAQTGALIDPVTIDIGSLSP